jgi:protein-L-isoaspartate O-methyltransferase
MTALDWQPLANALAATLEADGALHEPAWRRAFTAIPRHLFAPFFLEQFNGAEHVVDGADPAQRDHWLERVYSDTNLITQIKASDAD